MQGCTSGSQSGFPSARHQTCSDGVYVGDMYVLLRPGCAGLISLGPWELCNCAWPTHDHWASLSHVCPISMETEVVIVPPCTSQVPGVLYICQCVWSMFAIHLFYCGCGMCKSASRLGWGASAFHTCYTCVPRVFVGHPQVVPHTPNPLCSTDVCCRSLGCDAVSPPTAYLAHMGCTKCGSKRHTVFPGLSPSQNCPSVKDLRHPPHQYLVY